MAYTATATSISGVDKDYKQQVTFTISDDDGNVLITHTVENDADSIKDEIKSFLRDYKQKAQSNKRVQVGDSWTV